MVNKYGLDAIRFLIAWNPLLTGLWQNLTLFKKRLTYPVWFMYHDPCCVHNNER